MNLDTPAATAPAASTPATAAHCHDNALTLQSLPACLAPTPAEQAAHLAEHGAYLPAARLPRAGEMVLLESGDVTWLIVLDERRPVTADNTIVMSAPRLVRAGCCTGTAWAQSAGLDPDDISLELDAIESIITARDLLIEHANTPRPTH